MKSIRLSGEVARVRAAFLSPGLLLFILSLCAPREIAAQPSAGAPVVAATQGDRDHSRNIASQFLTGCNYNSLHAGCAKAFLHVPEDWPTVHLHLNDYIQDYSEFYKNSVFIDPQGRPGLAACCQEGIEGQGQRVLFYAGVGNPKGFFSIDNRGVDLCSFSVGDQSIRYLLTTSCNLFAHGRRVPGPGVPDFTKPEGFNPQQFDASIDPRMLSYVGNVFHAWGRNYSKKEKVFLSPLNPHLRLACGGSSQIGETNETMHSFWYYFSHVHLTPADAFLVGLYEPRRPSGAIVPLCISRGDSYQASGLVDSSFKEAPLAADADHLGGSIFIAYPMRVGAPPKVASALNDRAAPPVPGMRPAKADDALKLPAALPVAPTPQPHFLDGVSFDGSARPYGFKGGSAKALHLDLGLNLDGPASPFDGDDLCVLRQPKSGALIFSWRPVVHDGGGHLGQPAWLERIGTTSTALLGLLSKLPSGGDNKTGIVSGQPIVFQVQHDSAPREQNGTAAQLQAQKVVHEPGCLYVRVPTVYRHVAPGQQTLEVAISGEGEEIFAKVCPVSAVSGDTFSTDGGSDSCLRSTTPIVSLVYSARAYSPSVPAKDMPFVPLATAQADAMGQVAREEPNGRYEPPEVSLVYRAAPIHCEQTEMYLLYRFEFQPQRAFRDRGFPPLTIEVPAHQLDVEHIEDSWNCAPERPE